MERRVNRRSFLIGCGTVALSAAFGCLARRQDGVAPDKLEQLFDPAFEEAAGNLKPRRALASLRAKGVIDERGTVDAAVVRKLAKTAEEGIA